jgi:hypothetical protein
MLVRLTSALVRLVAIMGIAATLGVGALTTVAASPVAASTGVDVFAGYADNLRANAANFPTPWAGDSTVIYDGCNPASCTYDGGAVRIVNNTGSSLTINSVVLHFGTCTYDMWTHNVTLAAGNQLIVTQKASGAGNGCSTDGTMDSSDIGPGGAGWAGRCDQSGVIPKVDVTIDGVTSTFSDDGQVLNTGGIDLADCNGGGHNESTQWTLIGNGPCFGSHLILKPSSQTDPIGTTATVEATYANSCEQPLQGATVHFNVVSGPNAGVTGSGVTDSNGDATFRYTGLVTGSDTVHASITNLAGTIDSNNVTVDWTKDQTTLSYTGPTSQDYHDPVTVSANLVNSSFSPNAPIAGMDITFTLNGTETCTGTTDSTGTASCSITPGEPAGPYTLTASYAGNDQYLSSQTSADFTVTLEETALSITSSNTLPDGSVVVSANLTEDGVTPIAGRTVTFTAGGATGTGTTDSSGNATATLDLSPGQYTLNASFAGDSYYLPSDATAQTLYVYQPTQFLIWGGNNPDLSQAVVTGQDYTFWGAQWAKQVTAGDYQANNSFKGYADVVSGNTWTSSPGNSSNPPSSVGSYIGVIVTTQTDKTGSSLSGNIAELVVLRVDDPAAYQPNPGHPASGVAVAIVH